MEIRPLANRIKCHRTIHGAVALFAILVLIYSFSVDIRASRGASITGDEPFYLLTTQSLIEDGDLDLVNQYRDKSYVSFFDHADPLWYQSVPRDDGRLLSPHNPGLSVFLIPGFAAAGLIGAQAQLVLVAALTFALAYLLSVAITGAKLESWLVTFGVGLSATAFIYSSEVYPEVPAAALLLTGLLILTRPGKLEVWPAMGLVLCVVGMMWLGVKYAPLGVVLIGVSAYRASTLGRMTILLSAGTLAIPYVLFHLATFGELTPYNVNVVYAGTSTGQLIAEHASFSDRAYRLYGLFIDERFGIARWAPLIFLAAPGFALSLFHRGWSRLLIALIGIQILIATFFAITMMGWWFPGRTLMTVLPLFIVPITLLLLNASPYLKLAAIGLALYSIAITGSLAYAGHTGEVVIAVDPFGMDSPLFKGLGIIFPDYRSWSVHTIVATTAWLATGVLAMGLLLPRLSRSH